MTDPVKLGKYEIRRVLGRGAMGVVYEAYDPTIERIVALKTIRNDQLEGEEAKEILARFPREAKAAGRLNHPNIVSIYDFGEDNGTWFIAMEFVHGRELKDYFDKNERFRIADIVRIMGQLLGALDYSHINGVVHRDIKPANIIILPEGTVKIADFGIARIDSSQYTQAGSVLGTPAYMSPEQFMGQTVDGRSDIYSAGVVLYQFLTGERPFTGGATTIMHKVLNEDPPPPSILNVQVPKQFDAVISKAMAKRPEDRYEIARQFAEAIRLAAENKISPGAAAGNDSTVINLDADATVLADTAPTATRRVPATPRESGPALAVPASAAAANRKSPIPVVAAVAAGIAALGIAAYFLLFHAKSGDAPATASSAQAPAPTPVSSPAPPAAPAARTEPGTMIISGVGLIDPNDQKYQADKNLLAADLRADARSQLVEKAVALYLDRASLAKNYELLRDKLLAKSGNYIASIVQEGEPELGKDGLMHVTTQATVKVREVQKSLNQMSRDERVEFIRNNGDPKISVAISVRGEGADAPAQNSLVAENLLKERIKSFGFRIWTDEAKAPARGADADFAVVGEARLKKLSAKLAASGITIEKYLLTSWTVKCTDRQTGEEIYFNNKLPVAAGSWATEEQALAAIGGRIADEFSRDFFAQHFNASEQNVALRIDGLPDKAAEDAVARELTGLQLVISAARRAGSSPVVYDMQLAGGTGPLTDIIAGAILKPLNAKLGQACFNLGATAGEQVTVNFDKACHEPSILARLDSNPPASLYAAPPARQKFILRDPAAIRKLSM
jgi:tRNA A-37 threonylcarbamoyl transferase component Bud32